MDLNLPESDFAEESGPLYMPRRSERVRLSESTLMRGSGSPGQSITICDLSTSGFMAECMRPVLIGSYVSLDLPGIGPVNAQVRWQVGGRLGGKFLDPISLHRCEWVTGGSGR